MNRIYKYWLSDIAGLQTVSMPVGAQILRFAAVDGQIYIWAIVDTEAAIEDRQFHNLVTGDTIDDNLKYLGTVILDGGAYVVHVCELTS